MKPLTNDFIQQLSADPDGVYTVMITQRPEATDQSIADMSTKLQPIEGLRGIYKAQLSGREILRLQNDNSVEAIEPDDQEFHALT